jgi:ABC-type lipoprotein release transport system permease subunit
MILREAASLVGVGLAAGIPIALAASYLPACRAASLDPTLALREE